MGWRDEAELPPCIRYGVVHVYDVVCCDGCLIHV